MKFRIVLFRKSKIKVLETHNSYNDADRRFLFWAQKYEGESIDILVPNE